jgi:hypothetical protein
MPDKLESWRVQLNGSRNIGKGRVTDNACGLGEPTRNCKFDLESQRK